MGWIKAAWTFLTSNLAIAGGAILAVFYGIIKYQSGKIEDLEQENAGKSKKIETQEAMKEAEIKAEAKESEEIKDFDDSDWNKHI